MNITITRPTTCGKTCTISRCEIDGKFVCYILEDLVREVEGEPVSKWKIYGKTAIPRGTYRVVRTHSARFERQLPLLENVPGYSGVRIHPGNTEANTEGCLLPGLAIGSDGESVARSRDAFSILDGVIKTALDIGAQVMLTIK